VSRVLPGAVPALQVMSVWQAAYCVMQAPMVAHVPHAFVWRGHIVLPLLGPATFEGGFGTAAMGLALHFFIALVVVLVFYAASRKIRVLREHAALSGVLYGVAVYLVMYWIVLPAAFPKFRHSLSNDPLAIAIHIVLIGLPTALILRRAAPSSTG